MGVIQSSINSVLGEAAHLKSLKNLGKDIKDAKKEIKFTKEEKNEIETMKFLQTKIAENNNINLSAKIGDWGENYATSLSFMKNLQNHREMKLQQRENVKKGLESLKKKRQSMFDKDSDKGGNK